VWGSLLKRRKGPFYVYKTVVKNERNEIFALFKQKNLEQKNINELLTDMDVTI